ncbi:MAG: phosphate signaling complex protein PhoU [Candidatus Obscuribacterales bacterium]|nr:phosphate signaling complex protein PhoU [Steroidobacteraceae bacterium]
MSMLSSAEPSEGHIAASFDQALTELRLHVAAMGGLVIDQVSRAAHALLDDDISQADLVLGREDRVNELERNVDREAFRVIALHQPMAVDLRITKAVSRVTVDLERAGDEAKKIARFAKHVAINAPHAPVIAVSSCLRRMSALSVDMLRNAVRALDESDLELANRVAARDLELDAEFENALRQILTVAMEDRDVLRAIIDTVFVLKSFERIGDHAKNIAEQAVFMVSGVDVRHRGKSRE